MSQQINEPGQGNEEVVSQETSQQESTGNNPAWNELLGAIPTSLHSQVTPHLEKWDKNYQEGIGKVHSQYEGFKPFLENNVNPDQISYALQVMDAINEDPRSVMNAMKEYIGENVEVEPPIESEQGQEPATLAQSPEFKQMSEMVNTMAQLLVQRNQDEEQATADRELESTFEAAKKQFGDFDEEWVMAKLLADPKTDVNTAVQNYQAFVKDILAKNNRPVAPTVLNSQGTNPHQNPNPAELDGKSRRELVAQMLANAAHNG